MAVLNVNPTRIVLSEVKRRLYAAQRGHKLLKGKRDELMRRFADAQREERALRERVYGGMLRARGLLRFAAAASGEREIGYELLTAHGETEISVKTENVMSVILPRFEISETEAPERLFGIGVDADLLGAGEIVSGLKRDLIRLAEVEKAIALTADELERTRRRVNALEHSVIPDCAETVRYIRMRLEENERAAGIRLLKIKDSVIEKKIGGK